MVNNDSGDKLNAKKYNNYVCNISYNWPPCGEGPGMIGHVTNYIQDNEIILHNWNEERTTIKRSQICQRYGIKIRKEFHKTIKEKELNIRPLKSKLESAVNQSFIKN